MSIPNEITFDRLPPIGYPNVIKMHRFLPNTNSIAQPGDIIRFNISTQGFWDPYTAYINIEIDVSEETTLDNHDLLQIDSSASSFISEFIATCKGGELERVSEYDVLASFLNDVSLNNEQRQCRDIEGLGNNSRAFNKRCGSVFPDSITIPSLYYNSTDSKTYFSKDQVFIAGPKPWVYPIRDEEYSTIAGSDLKTISNAGYPVYVTNGATTDIKYYSSKKWYDDSFSSGGAASRASVASSEGVGGESFGIVNNLASSFSSCDYSPIVGGQMNTSNIKQFGISNIFNNDLTQGCFEPLFSKGISLPTMMDGIYKPAKLQKRQFCVPLFSGIFGCLMPRSSYKFLPMVALEDLVLEFRLNPFAMFTSGYKIEKGGVFLKAGDSYQLYGEIPRKWRITKFEICVEMIHFDSIINNIITTSLESEQGINFHTTSWYLGPQYSLAPGTNPSGTYQLNLGFESLKTLILMFLPQEYLKHTYLRKLYRINCGITSIQLRIGMELYPSLPLKGHSGTSSHYAKDYLYSNNNEYLISLQKSFQKFQNKDEDCAVNTNNFAVNKRFWLVEDDTQLTLPTTSDYYLFSASASNWLSGYNPLIWENRCVGKALFCLDLESMSENDKIISGLNTLKNKPFEILITSDSGSVYHHGYANAKKTENVSMYIWCQYDMVVQLKKYSVKIMGRGSSI